MSVTQLDNYNTLILNDPSAIRTVAKFEMLTPEECDAIISSIPLDVLEVGKLSSDGVSTHVDTSRRIALSHRLSKDKYGWVYAKAAKAVREVNESYFQVDVTGFLENALYMKYPSSPVLEECGFFDWHKDIGVGYPGLRKISMSVSLSNPEDYEGGDFHVFDSKDINHGKLQKGTGIAFPSFVQHKVDRVTQGERHVIVFFASGPRYR